EEAIDAYARPAVRIAIVDRSLIAEDLERWQRVRADAVRQVDMILTSIAPDDRAMEQFGRAVATAVLVPPFELRALHAAVRAGSKECV
ncbi:MAG: hypothetical protein ACRD15_00990, partial [Vicinamibacterales bacterium]